MAEKETQKAYVYMAECEDGSIYTGIAKDIKARMKEHYFKTGKGAKYTRSRGVQRILMVWEAKDYSSAARLEYAIKHINRAKKLELIAAAEEKIPRFFPKLVAENYVPRREYIMDVSRLFEGESSG